MNSPGEKRKKEKRARRIRANKFLKVIHFKILKQSSPNSGNMANRITLPMFGWAKKKLKNFSLSHPLYKFQQLFTNSNTFFTNFNSFLLNPNRIYTTSQKKLTKKYFSHPNISQALSRFMHKQSASKFCWKDKYLRSCLVSS